MSAPSHERSAINHPLYHQRLKQQANHGSTAAEWGLDQDDLRHERYHRKPHRPDLGREAFRSPRLCLALANPPSVPTAHRLPRPSHARVLNPARIAGHRSTEPGRCERTLSVSHEGCLCRRCRRRRRRRRPAARPPIRAACDRRVDAPRSVLSVAMSSTTGSSSAMGSTSSR
jgi:hypothetical protein